MFNGYIQISLSGGIENRGGVFAATKDENTVMFNVKQMPAFEQLKEKLEELMDRAHAPAAAPATATASVADEIAKLAALRDQGILSPDEFEAKKRQLLGL